MFPARFKLRYHYYRGERVAETQTPHPAGAEQRLEHPWAGGFGPSVALREGTLRAGPSASGGEVSVEEHSSGATERPSVSSGRGVRLGAGIRQDRPEALWLRF